MQFIRLSPFKLVARLMDPIEIKIMQLTKKNILLLNKSLIESVFHLSMIAML